ncbi:hypothetical protein KC349_g72 [Hortaea werneckii]|nr:hypothetical protein KC349_g72 [Hortaea werneckii]
MLDLSEAYWTIDWCKLRGMGRTFWLKLKIPDNPKPVFELSSDCLRAGDDGFIDVSALATQHVQVVSDDELYILHILSALPLPRHHVPLCGRSDDQITTLEQFEICSGLTRELDNLFTASQSTKPGLPRLAADIDLLLEGRANSAQIVLPLLAARRPAGAAGLREGVHPAVGDDSDEVVWRHWLRNGHAEFNQMFVHFGCGVLSPEKELVMEQDLLAIAVFDDDPPVLSTTMQRVVPFEFWRKVVGTWLPCHRPGDPVFAYPTTRPCVADRGRSSFATVRQFALPS